MFTSSLAPGQPVSFETALLQSLPPAGGLYVPVTFPNSVPTLHQQSYADFAAELIACFVNEPDYHELLTKHCHEAFSFLPRRTKLYGDHELLELYHGPSLSFKDFGAQFLAQCITHLPTDKPRLILVATSGDTGSAVGAAFHQQPDVTVVILYPAKGVSQRQAHQLGCFGDNVLTLAIDGDFDACQSLVKHALADATLQHRYTLTTANSINVGRLLPQVVYYAHESSRYQQSTGRAMNLIVPSGNLGNVTAACWAKHVGYPIERIVIAQNANRFVVDYLQEQRPRPRPTIATLANAMDVGSPSNFARLSALYPDINAFRDHLSAFSVTDDTILTTIAQSYHQHNTLICPHTATAVALLPAMQTDVPFVIAATAHPAKFDSIVEPQINDAVPIPLTLQQQLQRPDRSQPFPSNWMKLKDFLLT